MNGFTGKRASDQSDGPSADERVLTWQEGRAMLPLVGQIARDVADLHQRLVRMRAERNALERHRRTLDWPKRARRYQLDDELRSAEGGYRALHGELETLGVALLDPFTGLVGFPTLVNDRRAYFSWQPGEDDLNYWNFAEELIRRPIPADWTLPPERVGRRARKRSR